MEAPVSRSARQARQHPPAKPALSAGAGRESRAVAGAVLYVALAIIAALPGCGTTVETPLPDLKTKAAVPEGGVKPKSSAEQKKAIDDLMAKRDAPR